MFKEINWTAIDWSMISGMSGAIGVVIVLLLPVLKSLKNLVLSVGVRASKERGVIEKLNLDLDDLSTNMMYMHDINISKSRLLKKMSFINISILLRKNINFKNLIEIIELTNKGLCFYVPLTKKIQLVNKKEYEEIKREDIRLHLYFVLGVSFFSVFIAMVFQSVLIETAFFKFFSIEATLLPNQKINTLIIAFVYILTLVFEWLWLDRKSPYNSYESLTKDWQMINHLSEQNIITPL